MSPEFPKTPAAQMARQEWTMLSILQTSKVMAWTAIGALMLGAAGFGVSNGRLASSQAGVGVIASELASISENADAPEVSSVAVADDEPEQPPDVEDQDAEAYVEIVSTEDFSGGISGLGNLFQASGYTFTVLEHEGAAKLLISMAFEPTDSVAGALRVIGITKDGKEIIPEMQSASGSGNQHQVVSLLCDFPATGKELQRIVVQRKVGTKVTRGDELRTELSREPSEEPARSPAPHFRQLSPKDRQISQALIKETEVDFVETPLRDALDYLEQLHGIDAVINEKEIADEGASPEVRLSLELKGASLHSALSLMLEPHDLDYVVKNEVLMITAAAKAEEFRELRVYDLEQLSALIPELDFDDVDAVKRVESVIKNAVQGDWAPEDEGGGTISLTSAGLVVRQNQRTHREIENLLEQLRGANGAK
jgi:hypothetical protein